MILNKPPKPYRSSPIEAPRPQPEGRTTVTFVDPNTARVLCWFYLPRVNQPSLAILKSAVITDCPWAAAAEATGRMLHQLAILTGRKS